MKILGIDPGTARMGYSIVKTRPASKRKRDETNGWFDILNADVLITPAGVDMHKRLQLLYKGLSEIVSKEKPDVMVIERLFFSSNAKTAITVGQARGVALLAAADGNMEVFEYTALEAKRLLTGYGRASKKEMQEAVRKLLEMEKAVKSDDANDAVAMALCYIKKCLGGGLR